MKTIIYEPDHVYDAYLSIGYRRRKPPLREPRWLSELNPTVATVVRSGAGRDLPNLVTTAQLSKIMERAVRTAKDGHLLYISIRLNNQNNGPSIAWWSVWSNGWSVAPLEARA